MGWTTPVSESTGYVVTATDWDNFIYGNTLFLYGDAAWTNVASFTNSWSAGGTAPGYILLGRVVYLRGVLAAGTGGSAAFTLPVGYRPSTVGVFLVGEGNATPQSVNVATSGAVTPLNTATTWLVNISFPVV